MRLLCTLVGLFGLVSDVCAADLPILRGAAAPIEVVTPLPPRWNGFYFGGQIGYGQLHADFSLLFNTPTGTINPRGVNYGAFIGYNTQWEGVVLGLEANYSHGSFGAVSATSTQPGFVSSNSLTIANYGTLRGRAGFMLDDCLLPFFWLGPALGYASMSTSQQDFTTSPPTITGAQGGNVIWGFTFGVGIDVALSRSVFLRAEYEYVQFAQHWISTPNTFTATNQVVCFGSQCILPTFNTVRIAAGVKF
jgi:outer membrane immunogenic protein